MLEQKHKLVTSRHNYGGQLSCRRHVKTLSHMPNISHLNLPFSTYYYTKKK